MMSHRFFGIIHCWLLRYGKTNSVVKDVLRSALPLVRARSPPCMVRIVRRRHPHRSTQTSASFDADIRIGRRRHPHRSAQTSASVGADVLIGGYGIPAIPTQPPPRSHIISRLRGGCVSKLQNRGGGLTVGGYGIPAVAIANSRNDLYFCC